MLKPLWEKIPGERERLRPISKDKSTTLERRHEELKAPPGTRTYTYFCDHCGYRKKSTKTPDLMRRCPYCGKESFRVDNITATKILKEVDKLPANY